MKALYLKDILELKETEIPESVSDRAAVFVEPLAAALEILEQVHIKPAQQVAVIGDGKLGLLSMQNKKRF